MRALICSTLLVDQDKIQITMKMSSLMKFRIIDYELCVCEYGLRAQSVGEDSENLFENCGSQGFHSTVLVVMGGTTTELGVVGRLHHSFLLTFSRTTVNIQFCHLLIVTSC
jgi:hypothetical protein